MGYYFSVRMTDAAPVESSLKFLDRIIHLPKSLHFMHARHNAAFTAFLAAALFGATTPLAKTLLGSLSPFMVAGLFYLGSGVGLAIGILIQRLRRTTDEQHNESRIHASEVPWLLGAIAAGGVAGPALLMLGVSTTPSSNQFPAAQP